MLRADIVAEMQRQKDFLSLFVTSDWDQYVRNMARSGTWGGAALTNTLRHMCLHVSWSGVRPACCPRAVGCCFVHNVAVACMSPGWYRAESQRRT